MKALLVTILATGGLQIANLVSGMLTAHLLAVEGRGELAAAQLWPTTLAYLMLFALNDTVLYFGASGSLDRKHIFATATWLGIGFSIIAIAIGWFFVVPHAYADYRPEVAELARVMLFIIPLHILGMVYQEMLRADLKMTAWNALRLAQGVGYILFILMFVGLGHAGVFQFGIAYMLAHVAPMVGALLMALAAGWGAARVSKASVSRMVGYGAKIHAGTVIGMLNSRIDQLLVASYLDPAALGLYVVATTLSQVTVTLANAVAMVAFPRACAAAPEERGAVVGVHMRLTLVMVVGASAVVWLAAPIFLRLLFGASFVDGAPIVRILILAVIPLSLREFFLLAFKSFDKALAISKSEIVTLIVNAALLFLLVPRFGLQGAAIAFVAVRWATVGYLGFLVVRDLKIAPRALFLPGADDRAAIQAGWQALRLRLGRAG